MTPGEQWTLAMVLIAVAVAFLVACYHDWRKQERERPKQNWRGPPLIRYLKNLLARVGDGLLGFIAF